MRVVRLVGALSLAAVFAFSAGSALAQGNPRLNDEFGITDTKCNEDGEPGQLSSAVVGIGGANPDRFFVEGNAFGLGTDGDEIQITYSTDLPNKASASDEKGDVSQKVWSEICVDIDCEDCVRETDGDQCVSVEKCAVKGSVIDKNGSGKASAKCSGTDLYSFLTSDQLTSLQAAFPKGNKCGVKINAKESGKKSSLGVNLNQKPSPGGL